MFTSWKKRLLSKLEFAEHTHTSDEAQWQVLLRTQEVAVTTQTFLFAAAAGRRRPRTSDAALLKDPTWVGFYFHYPLLLACIDLTTMRCSLSVCHTPAGAGVITQRVWFQARPVSRSAWCRLARQISNREEQRGNCSWGTKPRVLFSFLC